MVREPVLYPRFYPWFLIMATLDVLLTWLILTIFHGEELNPIAASLMDHSGLTGAAFLKYGTVAVVMVACEVIGRKRAWVGRHLLIGAVAMNALAVGTSATLLANVQMP